MDEKHTLEEAEREAELMRGKIASGEASDYESAASRLEGERGKFSDGVSPLAQGDMQETSERKIETSEGLVESFSVFRQSFHPKAGVIYYPCCSTDASISSVFPESRIIYLDVDKVAVDTLKKTGYEAYAESALDFVPDKPVDILLMLNPSIRPDKPLESVAVGGYVICNDYHSTATELRNNPGLKLRGLVRNVGGNKILDADSPEDYWKEIDSEEEFRNAPFSFGSVHYKSAAAMVKRLAGKEENVLEEYKKIIAAGREESRKERERFIRENPEAADLISFDEDTILVNREGSQLLIDARLPRKKGTVDDLFVFQKIAR